MVLMTIHAQGERVLSASIAIVGAAYPNLFSFLPVDEQLCVGQRRTLVNWPRAKACAQDSARKITEFRTPAISLAAVAAGVIDGEAAGAVTPGP